MDLVTKPILAAGSGHYVASCARCQQRIGRLAVRWAIPPARARAHWRWRLDGSPGSVRSRTGPSVESMELALEKLAAESSHVCEDKQ